MAKTFKLDTTPLYNAALRFYSTAKDYVKKDTGRFVLPKILAKGSARSSKTYSFIKLIVTFCDHNREEPLYIAVLRSRLTLARDYTFKDFLECFQMMGLEEGVDYSAIANPKPKIRLWGSTIDFFGLSDDASASGKGGRKEAPRSDIVFVNEVIENQVRSLLDGWIMRCEMLFMADFNPTLSDHWVYTLAKEENVRYFDVSYLNNPFLSDTVVESIEAKCPWDFSKSKIVVDDYGLAHRVWDDEKEEKRPPHPVNTVNGTADRYWWLVYGEGKAAQMEGAVFSPDYLDEYPEDEGFDDTGWGLDFGYTVDPSVLTRVGRQGRTLTIKYETWQSCSDTDTLYELISPTLLDYQRKLEEELRSVDKEAKRPLVTVACDSADKYRDEHFVRELNLIAIKRNDPLQFVKVKKPNIVVRIALMKKFKLRVVRSIPNKNGGYESVTEFTNYVYESKNGVTTNMPIDKYNHGIDSAGYAIWHNFRWVVTDK